MQPCMHMAPSPPLLAESASNNRAARASPLRQRVLRRRVNLLVVTAGGARDASAGAAERYWRDAHAPGGAAAPAGDGAAEPPPAAFEVAYVPSMEDAHRALQAALSALRRARDRADSSGLPLHWKRQLMCWNVRRPWREARGCPGPRLMRWAWCGRTPGGRRVARPLGPWSSTLCEGELLKGQPRRPWVLGRGRTRDALCGPRPAPECAHGAVSARSASGRHIPLRVPSLSSG